MFQDCYMFSTIAFFMLKEGAKQCMFHTWLTTNIVMAFTSHLEENDTIHMLVWELINGVWEIKKHGLGLKPTVSLPQLFSRIKESRPIHDAQHLIIEPIFNLDAKDFLEMTCVAFSKCSTWLFKLRKFNHGLRSLFPLNHVYSLTPIYTTQKLLMGFVLLMEAKDSLHNSFFLVWGLV